MIVIIITINRNQRQKHPNSGGFHHVQPEKESFFTLPPFFHIFPRIFSICGTCVEGRLAHVVGICRADDTLGPGIQPWPEEMAKNLDHLWGKRWNICMNFFWGDPFILIQIWRSNNPSEFS